jgi:Ca2+-transporting ATPase
MTAWHNITWVEVLKKLNTDINNGLSLAQVEEYRKKDGNNSLNSPKVKKLMWVLIDEVKQVWSILVFITIGLLFVIETFIPAEILVFYYIFHLAVTLSYAARENRKLQELNNLNKIITTVVRAGHIIRIPCEELVKGDIVLLQSNEMVPADIRILECNNLKVKESSITGEKAIVDKFSARIEEEEISISEMGNILFRASTVVEGDATGVVIATGMETQIARIISYIYKENMSSNFINKYFKKTVNQFTLVITMMALVFTIPSLIYTNNLNSALKSLALIIILCTPFSSSFMLNVVSAYILEKFKKRGVILKNLSIVENLSKIDLLCTDKYGFFSKNEMIIEKMYIPNEIVEPNNMDLNEVDVVALNRLISIGVLCNDSVFTSKGITNYKDDSIEISLVKYGDKMNIKKRQLEREQRRIFQIPFDSHRRIMTTVNKFESNFRANVKGSVDFLIDKCTQINKNGIEREITEEDKKVIKDTDIIFSGNSLNVIALAYRNFNYEPSEKENIESNLVFSGLIAFNNPICEDTEENIKMLKMNNIRPVIITDENRVTAFYSGKKIDLIKSQNQILSGIEIDNTSDEEFNRIADRINIFSRISPINREKLCEFYRNQGRIFAMAIGKLIDFTSLMIADIGIGYGSSSILRNFSDVYLEETSLEKIISIIESSKKVIINIKNILIYLFSCVIFQTSYFIIKSFLNFDIYLTFYGILFVNLITISIFSFFIICNFEKVENYHFQQEFNKDFFKEGFWKSFFNGITAAIICTTIFLGIFVIIKFFGINSNILNYYDFIGINLFCALMLLKFVRIKS